MFDKLILKGTKSIKNNVEKAITTADLIIDTWKKATIEQIVQEEKTKNPELFKEEQDIWKLELALDSYLNRNEYSASKKRRLKSA